jgi:hypothetical protein
LLETVLSEPPPSGLHVAALAGLAPQFLSAGDEGALNSGATRRVHLTGQRRKETSAVPDAAHYRSQAERCRMLASGAPTREASILRAMADEYEAKANEIDSRQPLSGSGD